MRWDSAGTTLDDLTNFLKKDLLKWMQSHRPPLQRKDLAELLEFSSAHISSNLNPEQPMTAEFVARLAFRIERYSGILPEYYRRRYGKDGPSRFVYEPNPAYDLRNKLHSLKKQLEDSCADISDILDDLE